MKALIDLERWDDEVFARGIACVQREPVWGGSEDTAAHVRGLCALGYAQLGHVDAVSIIADVLADAEHPAREAAARALGDSGRAEAVPPSSDARPGWSPWPCRASMRLAII